MPFPFEVCHRTEGRKGKKSREVIGAICPTVLGQIFGAQAILVSMGDSKVDWHGPTSAGFEYWLRRQAAERSE